MSLFPVPDVHISWLLKADENISEFSQVSLEPVQMDYARTSCECHTCDRCPKQDSQRIFYCSIGSDARIFPGVSGAVGNGGPRKKLLAGMRVPRIFGQKAASDVLATVTTGTVKRLLMLVQASPLCFLSTFVLFFLSTSSAGRQDMQVINILPALDQQTSLLLKLCHILWKRITN